MNPQDLLEKGAFQLLQTPQGQLNSARYTAVCFVWQHLDGYSVVMEILARSSLNSKSGAEIYLGDWTIPDPEGNIEVKYLAVAPIDNVLQNGSKWRGFTTTFRLDLWKFHSDDSAETCLTFYHTNTSSKVALQDFLTCVKESATESFSVTEIPTRLDSLQIAKLRTQVPNANLLEAISDEVLDQIINNPAMSLKKFLTTDTFTEKFRQLLLLRIVAATKIKIRDQEQIPNMWGIHMPFVSSSIVCKLRHYYIYGPANYGKSLFKEISSTTSIQL